MIKTVTKIGNSHGIIFDAAVMDLAHVKAGDQFNLEIHDGGNISLTSMNPHIGAKTASGTARRIIRKNAELFRRLS